MQITINLDKTLTDWARKETNPEDSIKRILHSHIANNNRSKTPYDMAIDKLRTELVNMPTSLEFELSQIIGQEIWAKLDRSSCLAFGKHIKANSDSFGLDFIRKNSANHSIYRRKTVK